jgi:hypothetical protein
MARREWRVELRVRHLVASQNTAGPCRGSTQQCLTLARTPLRLTESRSADRSEQGQGRTLLQSGIARF